MDCVKHSFLDVYYDYILYSKKEQKNSSFSTMKYKFELHILPFFEKMYLEDITSNTILNWENFILKKNFSNNHNKNLYYILSGFFEYCKKFYNFDKSIISNIGCFKKKYENKNFDFYTNKEFKRFIMCVDEEVYKQFFNLLFFTGVRCGEALALTFNDLKDGYIFITKTIESHGKREITTPKTYSSVRQIKIDFKLEKDLLKLKTFYSSNYDFDNSFYIFGGTKPLSPSTINRRKILACNRAEIRPITLHQFRHSHATFLIQNNIPVIEVSKRLGHSKVSTTLDIYSHTDLAQEKRVLNTLNSVRLNYFSTMKYKFKSLLNRLIK